MKPARPAAALLLLLAVASAVGCGGPAADGEKAAAATATKAASHGGADAGHAAHDGQAPLCEHRVTAELCTRCNPDLADAFRDQGDWCDEHGVPESQCFACNPDLSFEANAATPKDWCTEHAVPESKCTKCKPSLTATFLEANNYCRVHGFPADACPICHPDLVRAAGQMPPAEAPLSSRIRLASSDTAAAAGIETTAVRKERLARTLEVVGQLAFDQNRLAQLAAQGDARVLEVTADIGDDVAAGQPLVVVASASVGQGHAQLVSAKAQVAAARANVERERGLAAKGISSRKSVEDAQAELARAQAAYDEASAALNASGAASAESGGRYELKSPFGGTVISRNAVAGRTVADGEILMQVADLSVMWALLDVPEADAREVRAGQPVELSLDGRGAESVRATVSRVGSAVDPSTRTVPVRVEVDNADRRLKSGAFVRARIEVAGERDTLLVPQAALQKAEGRSVVFVRKNASIFEPVTVQPGDESGGLVEVAGDLRAGDQVVTTGAFLLKTEVLKDSIGAGCCEESE